MAEQITAMMTASNLFGQLTLPRRNRPKGLLTGLWVSRGVRVEYRDASGRGQTMSGKLLDTFPTGTGCGCQRLPYVAWLGRARLV